MEIFNNLWRLVEIGGPVMVPIFLISGWLWALIMFKSNWLWRINRDRISLPEALACLKTRTICDSATPRGLAINQYLSATRGGCGTSLAANKLLLDSAIRKQTGTVQQYIPTQCCLINK
ncbi:MAG: hypothetical protein CSB23_00345 [Deltaproteobacteria bacterium]|nr:MAG: hypothetical protein CSB23_00345 [Deltaproteobacteria bacterium]